jgi:branched-chain amino acid transport system substrate-binding protein
MIRRAAILLSALLLLTVRVTPAQETPVEIDAVLPLTGFGAFYGKAQQQGLQAFEALTNRTGGINGRPVKFVVSDDGTNPQISVQLFNQLIAKHAAVVLGPSFTASCGAVLPLIANGPLTYCLSPGLHPPDGSFMLAANVSTADLVNARFEYVRARGWTRIGTIFTNDASGQDNARQVDALLAQPENAALRVVARESFNPSDISVSAQMARIKAAGPQVLLTGATGAPFGTLLRDAYAIGLNVPVFASATNMTPQQMSQYAAFLPHDLLFTNPRGLSIEPRAPKGIQQAQRAFFDAFKAIGAAPGQGETIPWDPAAIVVDALRHLRPNPTPAQLRDYITGLQHWSGMSGDYDFRKIPQRGIGLDSAVIYRWDAAQNQYDIVSKPGGKI